MRLTLPAFIAAFVLLLGATQPSGAGNGADAPATRVSTTSADKKLISVLSGPRSTHLNHEMLDGAQFIDRMHASADSFADYSFDYSMTVYKQDKTVVERGNFFFKRPKLMRLEVTEGKRNGAVAVLYPDGKVRAKLKTFAFMPAVSLAPDSSLLRSANGYPMVESDFSSLAQALKKFMKEGVGSRVSASSVMVGTLTTPVYVLEMYNGTPDKLFKRVFVDADKYLPVEWYDYEDGKLFTLSTWHNFKGNSGLSDQLFTVKGEN